eukprot:CAMPEP_0173263230 /NCGR_PEP_ID=MMETSP1142-20121109/27239_1 /TAXON_ID=483371 /ORGANISM="non described non described, Strain CCMP2298" /LENGTH=100 /DNA_ID=CAMNT_0014198505 /DNA_START=21 /DNA_END=320 /DNA_ORIENTATION=-
MSRKLKGRAEANGEGFDAWINAAYQKSNIIIQDAQREAEKILAGAEDANKKAHRQAADSHRQAIGTYISKRKAAADSVKEDRDALTNEKQQFEDEKQQWE